jgi:hypothetical protein
MSVADLLFTFQQKYPLPAQTTFFTYNTPVVAVVQDNVQEINLVGLPDIADYGITDPVVTVSNVSNTSTAIISGINTFDWGAGTARLWVSYANVVDFNIRIFVCQSKPVLN